MRKNIKKKGTPRLVEVFRRALREASIDWSKFRDDGPRRAKPIPDDAVVSTSADYEPKPEPETAASAKKDNFNIFPQPVEGGKTDLGRAKSEGFKKIKNFVIDPMHWERGQQGDKDAVNWEGTDWIKPKSPEAKEVARIIKLDKLRPTDIYKPEVWKKHFQHKFGKLE